jgi:hypothetical protein
MPLLQLYVAAAETEMVEWISALEGSIAKIAKIVAGVDDSSSDGHHKSSSSSREKHRSSSSRDRGGGASDWASKVCRGGVGRLYWDTGIMQCEKWG